MQLYVPADVEPPHELIPDSLLAFQRMFPDDDASRRLRLIEMRWPDELRLSRVRP